MPPVTTEPFDATWIVLIGIIGLTFVFIYLIWRKNKIGKKDVINAFGDKFAKTTDILHISKQVDPLNIDVNSSAAPFEPDPDYHREKREPVVIKWTEPEEREIIEVIEPEVIDIEPLMEPEALQEAEPEMIEVQDEEIYMCSDCPEGRLHKKENMFQCDYCGQFYCDYHINTHIHKQHRAKNFVFNTEETFLNRYTKNK